MDNEQKLSACKNSILHVPRILSVKFFLKKCIIFKLFTFWANFSAFGQKTSSRIARTEMYVSTKKIGKKIFCWKICVCYFFSEMSQKLSALWRIFFRQRCENCFDVSIISKWEFFLTKKIFFSIFAHCAIPFRHTLEDFWAGLLENTILFFIHFRKLSEQFLLFWQKKAVGLPKLHSTSLQGQFERINFLKKSPMFYL